VSALFQNVRYALRQLRKSPVFTVVSVLTIALGIGASTSIFTVINAVLLRYLPVEHPEQLVYFHLKNQPMKTGQTGWGDMSMSLPIVDAMRARRDVFSDVVGFAPLAFGKTAVRLDSEPEEALGEMVSGNFFSALQLQPFLGRGFTAEDESTHAAVAVLNYSWWSARFASDKNVLGRTIFIKGLPFTIVGVAPSGFNGVDPFQLVMDFWIPLQNRPELNAWGNAPSAENLYTSPAWLALDMFGRLQPGVSLKQAEARLTPAFQATFASVAPPDPHEEKPLLILSTIRGAENLREDYQGPLQFLMGMVLLVLLIACSNVAMLILARNAGKLSEFRLRQALGAGRRALFFSCLRETFLLVAGGAGLGWIFAGAATQALVTWSGIRMAIELDRRVLLFTGGISLAVAIAFALAPMPLISELPLHLPSRSSGGTAGMQRGRLLGRKLVVSLQISLCLVLLCAAGLLFRTLRNLESSDLGMRTAGLLVFGVSPQSLIHTDAEAVRFHLALFERLRSLPGVDSATLMQIRLGGGGSDNNAIQVDGRNPAPEMRFAAVRSNSVGPGFLRTLGIPLLLGRDIADSDTASSAKVAIVNQTFVDRYLPSRSPLGHRIRELGDTAEYSIVGVAGNSRYTGVRETERPMAYVPFAQTTGILAMQYELHTFGDPRTLIRPAARVVRDVDPTLPLEKPMTQIDQFAESVSRERLVANLSGFFGALAAFLVAMGLYGTISYGVNRRTSEIGVRMALGAQRGEVLGMVLRESLLVAAVGLAIGLPAALLAAKALRSMLYGLRPGDPLTFLLALSGVILLALTAALIPARRASKVDPNVALRYE
jgi:predicted permease